MIHILTGENFQVQRAYQKLLSQLLSGGLKEFNLDRLVGKEATAARIQEKCCTLPMMAPRRVVVIEDAQEMRREELEKLEPQLGAIAKNAELIFLAEKLDRRLKVWQKVAEIGRWLEFRPLSGREAPRWILEECRLRQKKIRSEAVDWLAERFGSEAGLIASALEKVALLMGAREEITIEDLEQTVSSFSWRSLFELTDAIGAKRPEKALSLFRQMMLSGESPVGILALIARHFRILFKVKETGEGAPPYFLKNYQQQANGFSEPSLRGGIGRIFRTDWELKSSRLAPDLLMERLIWELCR